MNIRLSIFFFAFGLAVLVHPSFASAVANGEMCASNAACDSGYCNLGGSDIGTCANPPGGTGTSPTNTQNPTGSSPTNTTGPAVQLLNPLKSGTSLENFLTNILQFVIRIGAVVVVLMIVWVGFLFVTAQGNESKLTAARQALLWTIVGALILLGAQAIALGIQGTVQALGG